ncbi:MAG: 50S ribosomal protein L33 [Erysipelotrichaceae bacterium]|nr:50S ribosomal protein L33 [Erysipelotrichaceae bacterium]
MPKKDRVILTCTQCLSRNYSTHKNKKVNLERLELMKFCKRCGTHTIHKETK